MSRIKVYLSDSEQIFVDAVGALLEGTGVVEVVGKSSGEGDFQDKIWITNPDILIMDLGLSKINGMEKVKSLRENFPNTKILILSNHRRRDLVLSLMEIGVNGYLFKDCTKEELKNAIKEIYQEKPYYALNVLSMISNVGNGNKTKPVSLTQREIEVLQCLAEGDSVRETAQRLFVSIPTINSHRRNIMKKLGMANNTHLVKYAIKNGFVEA